MREREKERTISRPRWPNILQHILLYNVQEDKQKQKKRTERREKEKKRGRERKRNILDI